MAWILNHYCTAIPVVPSSARHHIEVTLPSQTGKTHMLQKHHCQVMMPVRVQASTIDSAALHLHSAPPACGRRRVLPRADGPVGAQESRCTWRARRRTWRRRRALIWRRCGGRAAPWRWGSTCASAAPRWRIPGGSLCGAASAPSPATLPAFSPTTAPGVACIGYDSPRYTAHTVLSPVNRCQ